METKLYFFCALFLLFAVLGRILLKNIMNPITVFSSMWALIIFLYSLHLYELYYATDLILNIVVVGVICFSVGGFIRRLFTNSLIEDNKEFIVVKPNYKLILFFNMIASVLLVYYGFVTIRMLRSGYTYNYIRFMFEDEDGGSIGGSQMVMRIWNYFITPWSMTLVPLLTQILITDKGTSKDKKNFIIFSIINVTFYVIICGGRASLVNFMIYGITIFFLQKKKIKFTSSQKLLIVVAVGILIYCINALSVSRGSKSVDIMAYIYLCGCLPFATSRMDIYLNSCVGHTYGLTSFYGVYRIFLPIIIRVFGRSNLLSAVQESIYTQDRSMINPDISYNAFVTPFYYFYIDGGMIGVALLSMIFGYFCTSIYLRYLKNPTSKILIIYLLIMFSLIMSMVRFQFVTAKFVYALILSMLCFKNGKDSSEAQRNRISAG